MFCFDGLLVTFDFLLCGLLNGTLTLLCCSLVGSDLLVGCFPRVFDGFLAGFLLGSHLLLQRGFCGCGLFLPCGLLLTPCLAHLLALLLRCLCGFLCSLGCLTFRCGTLVSFPYGEIAGVASFLAFDNSGTIPVRLDKVGGSAHLAALFKCRNRSLYLFGDLAHLVDFVFRYAGVLHHVDPAAAFVGTLYLLQQALQLCGLARCDVGVLVI